MRRTLVTLMLTLFAASAQAQEPKQTVEGAHRFFAVLAETDQMWSIPSYNAWPDVAVVYRVTKSEGDGCQSILTFQPSLSQESGGPLNKAGTSTWNEAIFRATATKFGLSTDTQFVIDWSRVARVEAKRSATKSPETETVNSILISAPDKVLLLHFPNGLEPMAKRAAYAAEFLKTACDKTAETGF